MSIQKIRQAPIAVKLFLSIYSAAVATLLLSAFWRGDGLIPTLIEFGVNAICFLPLMYYLCEGRSWTMWAGVAISLLVFVDSLLDEFKLSIKDWVVNVGLFSAGLCVLSASLRAWFQTWSKIRLKHPIVEKCFAIMLFGWLIFMGYIVVDQERRNGAVIEAMKEYVAINDYDGEMTVDGLLPYFLEFEDSVKRIDVSDCPSRFRNKYEANLGSVEELIARLKLIRECDDALKEKMKTPWGILAKSVIKGFIAGKRAFDSFDLGPIKEARAWTKGEDKRIYEERKDAIDRLENALKSANEALRRYRRSEAELLLLGEKYGFQKASERSAP